MRLLPVGVSGSVPGVASPASCYLVEVDVAAGPGGAGEGGAGPGGAGEPRTWRVVLDLGSGAYGPLQALAGADQLDAVLLSHLHADHCLDVTALQVALSHGPRRRSRSDGPLPVWGPVGVRERLSAAYAAQPGDESLLGAPLAFHEWVAGEAVQVGPMTIVPVPVHHPVPAFGIRVTGPSEVEVAGLSEVDGSPGVCADVVLAYTGDTDSGPGLLEVASNADLLLAEAGFPSVARGGPSLRGVHLTGRRAGAAAREAGARRVLITHVPPWDDVSAVLAEAQEAFGEPTLVDLAEPGCVVRL